MTALSTLSVGCTFSDRIEALLDRRVAVPGIEMAIRIVEPQQLFRQTLNAQTFDVAELSIASHIGAIAQGRHDYIALPVFLSRSFRHSNIYVRTDRGIDAPADLAGRRVGLVDFQQTAALWLRGLLADDYGVSRMSIDWVTAGLHAPVLTDRMPLTLPHGVHVERSESTLDTLLAEGAIDAIISPGAPRCFVQATAPVDRLWPDYRRAEIAYWHEHRIFPIMHVLVLRRSIAEHHPWIGPVLFAAFDCARSLAAADLVARDFPKIAMPWVSHYARDAWDELGGDPWTYGVAENRIVLARLLDYAVKDGIANAGMTPDDIFS